MSRQVTLDIQEDQTELDEITTRIHQGAFDFSQKEKIIYTSIAALAVYLSWESSKFYFDFGGNGTQYLPIGNFTPEFGGQVAFWSRASVNWFAIMIMPLTGRTMYYQYQLAKEAGIAPPLWQPTVQLGIAFVLAITTGIVFGSIASTIDNPSLYNEIVTAAVNAFTNYFNYLALENLFIYVFFKITQWCYPAEDTEDSKDSEHSSSVELEEETPILPNSATENKLCSARNIFLCFVHLTTQFLNATTSYGFLRLSIQSIGDLSKSTDATKRDALGILIVLPSIMLKMLQTFYITSMICHFATDTIEFIKSLNCSRETFIKLGFMIPPTSLAMFGFFLAYVSANVSLDLNAQYGWNNGWNTYPTCLGALIFGGFEFLTIIMAITGLLASYALYTPEKRDQDIQNNRVTLFFKMYPNARQQLAERGEPLVSEFTF